MGVTGPGISREPRTYLLPVDKGENILGMKGLKDNRRKGTQRVQIEVSIVLKSGVGVVG